MFKKNLFSDKIEPACAYCERGQYSSDSKSVLCPKRGVVSPDYSCRSYVYAPLKREPRGVNPELPSFSPEDFEL